MVSICLACNRLHCRCVDTTVNTVAGRVFSRSCTTSRWIGVALHWCQCKFLLGESLAITHCEQSKHNLQVLVSRMFVEMKLSVTFKLNCCREHQVLGGSTYTINIIQNLTWW